MDNHSKNDSIGYLRKILFFEKQAQSSSQLHNVLMLLCTMTNCTKEVMLNDGHSNFSLLENNTAILTCSCVCVLANFQVTISTFLVKVCAHGRCSRHVYVTGGPNQLFNIECILTSWPINFPAYPSKCPAVYT